MHSFIISPKCSTKERHVNNFFFYIFRVINGLAFNLMSDNTFNNLCVHTQCNEMSNDICNRSKSYSHVKSTRSTVRAVTHFPIKFMFANKMCAPNAGVRVNDNAQRTQFVIM